jgi:hypothetical protein
VALTLAGGPVLAATDPVDGATAPPTTSVTVWTLGELAEPGPDALTLVREDAPDGEPAAVPGRLRLLPGGDGVRFVPDAPLAAGARYRAEVGASLVGADGAALAAPHAWSFRTGDGAPERSVTPRDLFGRPLASSADEDPAADAASSGAQLPASCAGLERDAYAPLLPAGATIVEAGGAEGACRIVVTASATPEQVRGFVERAILTNRLFLTANRADGEVVTIGARGAAFEAEAVVEPGPPTRLTWTLRPSE